MLHQQVRIWVHFDEAPREGGEGRVWRGQFDFGPSCAVKFYRDPRHARDEVERLLRMRGDRYARLLAYSVEGSAAFLALEYAERGTLAEEIDRLRQMRMLMTPPQALKRFREVLEALAEVHASGLIHRDVKPSNLLVFTDNRLKLCDFGLGRTLDRPVALQTRAFVGTFQYAAPEQIAQRAVDARADLYSAGVILYEMLAGRPFDRRAVNPFPSAFRSDIRIEVNLLLLRLLAVDPAGRPASALDAIAEVDTVLAVYQNAKILAELARLFQPQHVQPQVLPPWQQPGQRW